MFFSMVLSCEAELRPLVRQRFRSKTVTSVLSAIKPNFEPQLASMAASGVLRLKGEVR